MVNPLSINTKDAANDPSPLWIIALFVALSQLTAGAAAVATNGTTSLVFAIFAVSFPVLVLIVFVCLLLFTPRTLYTPRQYPEHLRPIDYPEGIRFSRNERNTNLVLKEAVTEAVMAAVVTQHPAADDLAGQATVRSLVAQTFEDVVDRNSVTLDRSFLMDGAEPVQIPVSSETTVDEFLDAVWFNISESVEPYTYNKSWILADRELSPLQAIGTSWAKRQGWPRDDRTLEDGGIMPGRTYYALPRPRVPGVRVPAWTWRSQTRKLATRYETVTRSQGLTVRRIAGAQRPRLVVSNGVTDYGLYVMAGHAEPSWITQASDACTALATDENAKIDAVLALEREPRDQVRAAGEERGVYVVWLDNAGLHQAPWDGNTEP
jgi:hypothetical protein